MESRNDTLFINGIKTILCFMVVVTHFYNYIGGKVIWGIPMIGVLGPRAVDVFFFFTGFLTVYAYTRNNKKEENKFFIIKRWFRLYPVYFVCIVCAYFSEIICSIIQSNTLIFLTGDTIGAYGYNYLPREKLASISDLVSHFLLLHGTFNSPYKFSILAPAWSLGIEWIFYIFIAISFATYFTKEKIVSRKGINVTTVLYVVALFTGLWVFYINKADDMQGFLRNLPIFLFGILLAQCYHNSLNYRRRIPVLLSGVLYLFILSPEQNWIGGGFFIATYILLFGDYKKLPKLKVIANILNMKCMKKLCNLSYSIYLVHLLMLPIAFSLTIKLGKSIGLHVFLTIGMAFIIYISLILIASFLLNRFIEKPAMCIYKLIEGNKLSARKGGIYESKIDLL